MVDMFNNDNIKDKVQLKIGIEKKMHLMQKKSPTYHSLIQVTPFQMNCVSIQTIEIWSNEKKNMLVRFLFQCTTVFRMALGTLPKI